VALTRIFMIRAKCDLWECVLNKIRGRIWRNGGYSRWIQRTVQKRKRKIAKFTSYSENSDTSVCKTNSVEDQWILMYKYKGHGVVFWNIICGKDDHEWDGLVLNDKVNMKKNSALRRSRVKWTWHFFISVIARLVL